MQDHESGDEGNGAPTEAWVNPDVEGDAEEEPGPVAAAPHAAPESHNPFHRVGAAEAKVDEAFATEVAVRAAVTLQPSPARLAQPPQAVFAQTGFTPVPKGVIPALKPEAFAKLDPESQHIVRTLTDRLVNVRPPLGPPARATLARLGPRRPRWR